MAESTTPLPVNTSEGEHTPTAFVANDADSIKKKLRELSAKRDALEIETNAALAYLSTTPVGLKGRLIDDEGFPRADVDHYAVREARHKVACNKNDLEAILNEMKDALEALHEVTRTETVRALGGEESLRSRASTETKAGGDNDDQNSVKEAAKASVGASSTAAVSAVEVKKAFLRVANVAPSSPAFTAGLRPGDHIHLFGTIDYDQFKAAGLAALAGFTRENEGQTVTLVVSTPDISTTLTVEHFIVPRRWAGPGLIGAEFDPLS